MVWFFVFLGSLFAGSFFLGATTVRASFLMLAVKAATVVIVGLAVLLIASLVSRRK